MNKKDLKTGYYQYGNKGSVWSDKVHIGKSGKSTTLCGTPMLASNWARIWEHPSCKCPECLEVYTNETNLVNHG